MSHPDIESQILISMARERTGNKGPVEGLRRHRVGRRPVGRIIELSGIMLISLGGWLQARGAQSTSLAPAGPTGPIMEA